MSARAVSAAAFRAHDPIAEAYWRACLAELDAIKPGNVGYHGAGHGMQVSDFITSAARSAPALSDASLSVGERILAAVTVTVDAVGCNTNLGIILLCAPLAAAAQRTHGARIGVSGQSTLRAALVTVLRALDTRDAQSTFEAIVRAAPAGLGHVAHADVRSPAETDLLGAMRVAADRDTIAAQYATDFSDLFDSALPEWQVASERWGWPWPLTHVYLGFLSRYPDSHVERKYGRPIAQGVQSEAKSVYERWCRTGPRPGTIEQLMRFDRALKARRVNPGTSADLTVASAFVGHILGIWR